MAKLTRVEIDLNIRTATGTFAGLEDCDGPVAPGDIVYIVEPESGVWGNALVTAVDEETRLVYLSVAWPTLSLPFTPRLDLLAVRDKEVAQLDP